MERKLCVFFVTIGMILLCCSIVGTLHGDSAVISNDQPFDEVFFTDQNNQNDCGCGSQESITIPQSSPYRTGLLPGGPAGPEKTVFTGATPSSWDWRNAEYNGITGDWTTDVRNQGNCGSCYAFGTIAAFESVINIERNNPNADVDLSEEFMVSCGQEWTSGIFGCDGGYFTSAFTFMNTYGAIPETCFPYTSGGSGTVPACSQKCSNWQDLALNIDDWHSVASDIDSMKNALITYGPLTVTLTVYDDFFDYDGGVYEHPGNDPDPTNHMVAIVGYDDANNCWICKNSWGTGWGENGWFRITYGDCNIGEEAAYLEYTDHSGPTLTITMHRIKMLGEIEGILEGDADWSYRVQVFDGTTWLEEINDAYSDNEDDHTEEVTHTFNVHTNTPEITIKVWDRDFWTEDDLADVSGYVGGGADNDISDLRGAIYHGTYDMSTNQIIPIDTIVMDGEYITTSGTYPPDNSDNSDAENDAKVWFTVSDNYEPPDPDLEVRGSMSGSATRGTLQYHLGFFTVENIGVDPNGLGTSLLDWEITTTPSWGTNWSFVPNEGTDLPVDQPVTVDVYVDVPTQIQTFTGEITIWNKENHADKGTVPITLTVPMNQGFSQSVFLKRMLSHFFSF